MKKTVYILLISILLAVFSPLSVLVTAESELPPLWDGTSAKGFAGGTGTDTDPYRIETAEQFAYFRDQVNAGESFTGKFIKLCADIRLNDESFTFDPDTGLVKVTDGEHSAYYGTGRAGDDSGDNTVFDTTASQYQSWYDENGTKLDSYPGILAPFTPIGYGYSGQDCFQGTFDGGGNVISGLFLVSNTRGCGLFAYVKKATVKNVHVDDSLVSGYVQIGGIVGLLSNNSTVRYCRMGGIVLGTKNVGGVVGRVADGKLSRLVNDATVIGKDEVGGVVGSPASPYGYLLNTGNVYGESKVGGIMGSSGFVSDCTNAGNVTGRFDVGGVVGASDSSLSNCHNIGTVCGNRRVGGIAGSADSVARSMNTGSVIGDDSVGGILSNGTVELCQNDGTVRGRTKVGGILGYGYGIKSMNFGSVSGNDAIGGIVGIGYAEQCVNHGDISGEKWIGGICGCAEREFESNIKNRKVGSCYNTGKVSGKTAVGGLVGRLTSTVQHAYNGVVEVVMSIEKSYNIGSVSGQSYIGSIVGKIFDQSVELTSTYYLTGSAVDMSGTVQSGIGSQDPMQPTKDITGKVRGCTSEELKKQETYADFLFYTVVDGWWIYEDKEYQYPVLMALSEVDHTTRNRKSDRYFYKEATCTEAELYHTSCSCGAILPDVFALGEKLPHAFGQTWMQDDRFHWHKCNTCAETVDKNGHTYTVAPTMVQDVKTVSLCCADCEHQIVTSMRWDELIESTKKVDTVKKAEFKLDLRFVLLLLAGVVLGVIGNYGVSVVKKTRADAKKKRNMSENFM